MNCKKAFPILLLLPLLLIISGCENSASLDETENAELIDTPSKIAFSGISSIDQKTDSTLRINWTAHADAVAYDIYNTTSGTPVYLTTVFGQATSSITLTNLTPKKLYKFRVRALDSEGNRDSNTKDISVTMNFAPNTPSTPTLHTPASSPNFDKLPIFTVNGVKKGDTVKIFSDATCSTELGSQVVAADGATSVEIQVASPLSAGTYEIYANATNSIGNASTCTGLGNSVQYTVNPCPANYIIVPENTDLNVNTFCVMKYEAKAQKMNAGIEGEVVFDGGDSQGEDWSQGQVYHPITNPTGYRPVSQADAHPWRFVNASDAKEACLNLGTGYDIITNAEWMTIAWNIENDARNWLNGNVGDGCLFRGNSGTDDACGKSNTDTEAGTGRDSRAKLTLSNNEEIWDFAGNVWEWTDWSHPSLSATSGSGFLKGPTTCSALAIEIPTIPTIGCGVLLDDDYKPKNPAGITPANYDSTFGLGRFWANSGGAAIRGGGWRNETGTGVFALSLNNAPTTTFTSVGFRCVFRP